MISLEKFYAMKDQYKDILPELEQYIDNSKDASIGEPIKGKHRGPRNNTTGWRKPETKSQFGWLINKKFNQDDDEKLYSQFRSILNKLSDSNLKELSNDLISTKITRKEHLDKLVEFIFLKAISEPKFSEMYAKLTKELSAYYILIDEQKIYFREILINKCQSMFNECLSFDKELEVLPKGDTFKFKDQVLGCMNYIGELYNQELLTDKIINSCFNLIHIKINLKKVYTVDILCTLIKTVGNKFSKKASTDFNICFEKINMLKTNNNLTIKEKFMIMDIIDLRKKEGW